ncbi:MAG: DegT/DnrJ/EryC1/StrS family aminotransferase [Nitrospiraceae bacterium]|nr:DegT/DnrJ/EryC1/StrS family aminotransferase [Nitrospiraceae bacterium]MDA8424023.1 DegT/DnrJ/EryC1/StrS family aminotransferase [Nitrospiraceae bacterium]
MYDSFFFFKGRVALYAILKAMGVGEGDEVILPGFTCVVVPNAIIYLGAKPVYADIDPETYNIDCTKIEEKITENTRAIIAQHTFGIPAEMDSITRIAKKYNLYVIEDSCHAWGSKYKGRDVGTFGDAAFFSSQWSKPLTTGLGGWAVLNNEELKADMEMISPEFAAPSARDVILLKSQYLAYSAFSAPSLFWIARGMYRKLSQLGLALGSSSDKELECEMPPAYAKRMSRWQKGLLERKLRDMSTSITHRKNVSTIYRHLFGKMGLKTCELPAAYDPVFLRYPVLVDDKWRVLQEAQRQRIEMGDWFLSPVHPNTDGLEKARYQRGSCPNAEKICHHIVNLPTHGRIGPEEARRVVDVICGVRGY